MTKARQQLRGSERAEPKGARCIGPSNPTDRLQVVVTLRRQAGDQLNALAHSAAEGKAAAPLSREAFAERFGAAPADVAKVEAFATEYGLTVERTDRAACTMALTGTVAQFQTAFGVALSNYEHPILGHFRGRTGAVSIPEELSGVVTAVLGLDDRAQVRPHFRMQPPAAIQAHSAARTFTPLEIASLYQFPDGDGTGQCIGIIELGGGYKPADLDRYFKTLGVPAPQVVSVSVDRGTNRPVGQPGSADNEVMLDIEIAGAIAPAARIAVYFAPASDAGFVDAITQALHDTTNRPSVISISWGGPESAWTEQAITAMNDALQSAVALGVTVCAASGDSGSSDGAGSADDVDFPAASPYVLACGGTRLSASGASGISSEVVWNDGASGGATGGGISARFALPAWQQGLSAKRSDGSTVALTKRGVPDVAGDASPVSGYEVLVDGETMSAGGTSAVAPLYAALIARINAAAGKPAGFVNAKLYRAQTAFNDITQGNNGTYAAAPGWDACTGLGSPNGRKLAAALGIGGS